VPEGGPELQAAVHAEISKIVAHLRDTAVGGLPYDDWIRDTMDWYLGIPLVGSCPAKLVVTTPRFRASR
jgi:hypothetical protein